MTTQQIIGVLMLFLLSLLVGGIMRAVLGFLPTILVTFASAVITVWVIAAIALLTTR